jgi:hypothetical protein
MQMDRALFVRRETAGLPGPRHRVGLTDALIVRGELILDSEVISLRRTILAKSDKFPEVAETFYHKAIRIDLDQPGRAAIRLPVAG